MADTAVILHHITIQTILLRQITQREDIIAEVSPGILSDKDALTGLVRAAIHGTDLNVFRSLRQTIPREAIIIIIPPM